MYNKYYYPISSTSLASIFGSACIYPAALYENRNHDVQSRLDEVILLTSNFGCQDCDCCLEVIITEEEMEFLTDLNNGFFIYEKPIPISRIKKIHFKKASQVDRTITSIRMSTAFIPESIIERKDNTFSNENPSLAELPQDFGTNIDGLRKQQDEYNRILGALALMKVAHVDECNVSPHYIDVLSYFNTRIKDEKENLGPIDSSLCAVFNNPKNLGSVITESSIEEAARKENQQVIKNKITKVIDLNSLTGHAYLYAILYTYGVENESKRKRIDELILGNFQDIKDGKEESVAFYYGYNRGYSILGNVYQNERNKVVVKFQMESLLDYYIVESVYDYVVFRKNSSGSFDIFDWVSPKMHRNARKGEYIVIDTLIRDKKKVPLFSKEWWSSSLAKFLKKDDFTFLGIDVTSAITEKVIKPWTQFVHDEIKDQFDEEKELFGKSLSEAQLKNESLKKEIDEKNALIKQLENQIEEVNQYEIDGKPANENNYKRNVLEEPKQNYGSTAASSKTDDTANGNNETPGHEINDAENSLMQEREIACNAIKYAIMPATEFKNAAKEHGLKVPKGYDKTDIILQLLGLTQDCDQDLFSKSE